VVTPLTPVEPTLEPELVDDETDEEPLLVDPAPPELDVVTVGLLATVLTDDVVDAWLARAGSRPDTSTSVIISQAATNSATAPEITRRRICRARAVRACARARAAAAGLVSVICTSWFWVGVLEASESASTLPIATA
jgi:hypothetical protein